MKVRRAITYKITLEVDRPGVFSLRVITFTHPIIYSYTDLLSCREYTCDYKKKIYGDDEIELSFEVVTADYFVGLREPIISRNRNTRTFYSQAEEIANRLSAGSRREFIKRAVRYVRSNIKYAALKKRIGIHEALYLGIGDCEEYTDALSALLSAKGFMIRRVVGAVPGGLHAWLEYKSKYGRIPIDPTRNQIGYVDFRHVPIFIGNKRPMKVPKGTTVKKLEVKLELVR